MRGGVLPPALLFAALAFALAYAPRPAAGDRRRARRRLCRRADADRAALGRICLLRLLGERHRHRRVDPSPPCHRPAGALVLGANAGIWAGARIALLGTTLDLAKATPLLALVIPAAWLVATGRGIALKVAGSGLIAIAALAMVLPIVPTPVTRPTIWNKPPGMRRVVG